MLGESITLTYNSVAQVLSRLNNDNFASIYQKRTATEEFRLVVRHLVESAKQGGVPFERHIFELTHTIFATPTAFEVVDVTTFTTRNRKAADPAVSLLAAKATTGWLTDANIAKLIAWES